MNVFINGIGNVSPQNTLDNGDFLTELRNEHADALWCIKPNFKAMLKGLNLRRMNRLLKNGTYSAQQCVTDAGQTNLDAIITGTGLGCQEDTEKFLSNIIGNEEGIVSPTRFVQSTHNAISAQIAQMLQCNNYNFTYAHRGASFESALMDAQMLVNEGAEHILVGGLDELTENYLNITRRMRMWKEKKMNQLDLFKIGGQGSIPGEGASFFLLSKNPGENCYASLKGIRILFKPKSRAIVEKEMVGLLSEHGLHITDIDIALLGRNGDSETDEIYGYLQKNYLSKTDICCFKHLCGEYKTAAAFGLWAASQIMQKQTIPEVLKWKPFDRNEIKNILFYNNYNNSNHSILLLQHVQT